MTAANRPAHVRTVRSTLDDERGNIQPLTAVYNLKVPVEAMRLGPNRVPAIAEWLCPPPDRVRGYFQYGEQPATIKLPHAELEVRVGHWDRRVPDAAHHQRLPDGMPVCLSGIEGE